MTSVQGIILLFTKYPEAGVSKTRLIPSLGAEGAARLQRRLTESMVSKLADFSTSSRCDGEIHHHGGSLASMRDWLGTSFNYIVQCDGDLGKRMATAISAHLGHYQAVILIGSDCPGIDGEILEEAFKILQTHEIVLGPAFDGGYYLIGTQGCLSSATVSKLFHNIRWGNTEVLADTLSNIANLKLSFGLLKKLHDIDTPEDLRHLDHYSYTE